MPRPVSDEGPWVTIPVRLRQRDVDALDAARGGVNRSEWVRGAVRTALWGQGTPPPAGRAARPSGVPAKPRERKAAEPLPVVLKPPEPAPPRPQVRRCPHPGTRVIGGYCKQCDAVVGPGGGY